MEKTLQQMIDSYGLEFLLEDNDILETKVLELLVEEGLIDPDKYFEEIEDDYV
jgi:hypothetical protein